MSSVHHPSLSADHRIRSVIVRTFPTRHLSPTIKFSFRQLQQAVGSVAGTIVKWSVPQPSYSSRAYFPSVISCFATRVYRFSEKNIWITGFIVCPFLLFPCSPPIITPDYPLYRPTRRRSRVHRQGVCTLSCSFKVQPKTFPILGSSCRRSPLCSI